MLESEEGAQIGVIKGNTEVHEVFLLAALEEEWGNWVRGQQNEGEYIDVPEKVCWRDKTLDGMHREDWVLKLGLAA